ncbi:hypothetical protein, unlikely [Trypanosoma congolense IL3000]|uniref:Uncharacterized protein n=1 Tax=Trypanosoma congolense (strain IL3000) TaxID=1068625 RepID=F9WD26_TRYCI|nr:conserved hypothetical protein [Trypanosoma congolense IL3000]CCD15174.1 hypothetical protein, unlikely [Trypanosoma congolense IL3000]
MKHKDGRGQTPPPLFSITNQKTGEVLLEITSVPPNNAPLPPVEEECCGQFNEALAFIAEAQARSYELFGHIVANQTESHSVLANAAPVPGQRNRFVEAVIPEDTRSTSLINSDEWDVDGFDGNGSDTSEREPLQKKART